MNNFWVKIVILAVIILALVIAVKFFSSPSTKEQIGKVDVEQKQVKPAVPPIVIKPKVEPSEPNQAAVEPNRPPRPEMIERSTEPNAPQPQPRVKAEPPVEPLDEAANIEADRLLEAVSYEYATGRKLMTFKKMVDACREIFKRYPNSQQAREAREYLRKMPARFRDNYKVTNEELGFTEQQGQTQ